MVDRNQSCQLTDNRTSIVIPYKYEEFTLSTYNSVSSAFYWHVLILW
jgi:hypothetical protein